MGYHEVSLSRLPIIMRLGMFIIAPDTLSGFREGPSQVSVPVLLVPFPFSLPVARPFTDRAKVQLNVGRAIEILKEYGADGWVRKCEDEMVKLA